ncbi:MAG: class I SAM-dependent methyltransferase [Anaerolineae bacterium]
MDETDSSQRENGSLWQSLDLSGVTLAIGSGSGQLLSSLAEEIALAGGTLLVTSWERQSLAALTSETWASACQAQIQHLPLRPETVDLAVYIGTLRDVPEAHLRSVLIELWRVLVPGGRFRIADLVEPTDMPYNAAWRERNQITRTLGHIMERPVSLSVDLKQTAVALKDLGFEDLQVALLPGAGLTDQWLQETVNALHSLAARLVDVDIRQRILEQDVPRLIEAYAQGDQRAAERFVLSGYKPGNLAVQMEIRPDELI